MLSFYSIQKYHLHTRYYQSLVTTVKMMVWLKDLIAALFKSLIDESIMLKANVL